MNRKLIKMSLLGSASALGINWIYDRALLQEFKQNNEVIFLPIQHNLYEKAKNGFDVYPNHKIGDLDFMGEVLYIFHKFIQGNHDSLKQFIYDHIGPNSEYDGYIETYGKNLIENINNGFEETSYIDKQLIGPLMYIIGYANNLSVDEVEKYSKVLTAYPNTIDFHIALKFIFNNISHLNKTDVLQKSIMYLPEDYQNSLEHSFDDIDVFEFIDNYSGVACGLEQSFPLIYYIINHTDSYLEALKLNAELGGASSARGLLIGAIYSFLDPFPEEYENTLNKDI